MNAARASFPQPDSPVTSTLASVAATRSARPTTFLIASDNATISVTIPLSKNRGSEVDRDGHRYALPPATVVRDHKSAAPFHRKHERRNRHSQPGSIPPFGSLRRGRSVCRGASVALQLHRCSPAPDAYSYPWRSQKNQ